MSLKSEYLRAKKDFTNIADAKLDILIEDLLTVVNSKKIDPKQHAEITALLKKSQENIVPVLNDDNDIEESKDKKISRNL